MIGSYLDMRARRGPIGFVLSFVVISVLVVFAIEGIYLWLRHNHHLSGLINYLGILVSVVGVSVLLTQVIRRLNDMGWCGMYALLTIFPATAVAILALSAHELSMLMKVMIGLGVAVLIPLCVIPGRSQH